MIWKNQACADKIAAISRDLKNNQEINLFLYHYMTNQNKYSVKKYDVMQQHARKNIWGRKGHNSLSCVVNHP